VPLEQVLADPPRVIIASGSERMLTHPVLRRLKGVRYERLDPALLYCGGPTVIRAVERLGAIRNSTRPREGGDPGPQAQRSTALGPRLRGDASLPWGAG
jgi:iron complex transport system substrate-binding protein